LKASVLQIPVDSPSKSSNSSPPEFYQTPRGLDGPFTYPTPESTIDLELETLYNKPNIPSLKIDQTSQTQDMTRPTPPLYPACYNCNKYHHVAHDCAIAGPLEQMEQAEGGEDVLSSSINTETTEESRYWHHPVCGKRGNAGHIAHDCTIDSPVAESLPYPGVVEIRRTVRETAGRKENFYAAPPASPTTSHAD
jgi:hypothetical protein